MRNLYDSKEMNIDAQKMKDEINPEELVGLVTIQFKPGGIIVPDFSCSTSQLALAIASLQAEFQRIYDRMDD